MDESSSAKSKSNDLLVFIVLKPTECGECGDELFKGRMITLEEERGALCLGCADLGHLEFLPAGDAALTRRSKKYSKLAVVVLRWARARKRYERQGILAEPGAIERAETECLADADARERRNERRRARDAELDGDFVKTFAENIRNWFPKCPSEEARQIAEHACRKHSGRIGRTAAAKEFDRNAIDLAVRAAVRHRHSEYDELLQKGVGRFEAREKVRARVDAKLKEWRG